MPSREALELGLHRDDATDDTFLVYADLLTQRGDPHGELIALSLAPSTPDIEQRIAELHAAHDATWLGPLATQPHRWERGFVTRATITEHDPAVLDLPTVLMRDLTFTGAGWFPPAIDLLATRGLPPALTTLRFDHGDDMLTDVYLDIARLYPAASPLRELDLAIGHLVLGDIDLPALRSFDIWTGGFTSANMVSITAARWPLLERLALRFGDPGEGLGGTCILDDILPLLASAELPNLMHLGLGNAAFIDQAIPYLARSPLLRQLRTLDISLGMLSDAGAEALLTHADAFSHLAWIDVSDSFIRDYARLLAQRLPIVHVGFEDPRHGIYCQIGEGYAQSQRTMRFRR